LLERLRASLAVDCVIWRHLCLEYFAFSILFLSFPTVKPYRWQGRCPQNGGPAA